MKYLNTNIQEVQHTPNGMNSKTPRLLSSCQKTERLLKWEERLITYRGSSLSLSADFSSALISAQNLLKLWGPEGSDLVYGGLVAKSCPTLATPWTIACQSPLSMGFSRQLHSTGVGCHFLLQGIFPSQESSLGLLHCRQILYWLSWSSQPRDQTQLSHVAGGFFTN